MIDTITIPYENPFKALFYMGGLDFTPDGACYVATIHGDVWKVTGIDETLGNVQTATQAYLWIAPKTGPLPTASSDQVNNAANLKPITVSLESNGSAQAVVVTASGLSIDLPAGDYWVSLTPRHSLGIFPYTVHLVTSTPYVGDPTAAIVACTVNSNWTYPLSPNLYDYAIKIEGDQATPTNKATLGTIKHIYR